MSVRFHRSGLNDGSIAQIDQVLVSLKILSFRCLKKDLLAVAKLLKNLLRYTVKFLEIFCLFLDI